MRVLVVAPTHRRFVDWCQLHRINPHSNEVRFINSAERIRGYGPDWQIAFVGDWWHGMHRSTIREIEHYVALYNLTPFKETP